jgi:hypothetical protein
MEGQGIHCRLRTVAARACHAVLPLAGAAAILTVGMAAAWACPTCKDSVNTSDPDGLNLARGYFFSILLMLAMPFTLAGSFGCYVWREMRRQRRASESATEETPS